MQFETAVLAACALRDRNAFLLGDATGVGKTRSVIASAQMLATDSDDGFGRGCAKPQQVDMLWFTSRNNLKAPLLEEFTTLQQANPSNVTLTFSTYGLVRRNNTSKLDDVLQRIMLAPPSTYVLVVMDEAHSCKNDTQAARSMALVQETVRQRPGGVMYCTATPASDVRKIRYMDMLRLWGPGSPFPSFGSFVSALERGGAGAMEMIAVSLSRKGMYVSRNLSNRGLEVSIETATTSRPNLELHDAICSGAVTANNIVANRARNVLRQMLPAFKAQHLIQRIKTDLAQGKSVIVGLQTTNNMSVNVVEEAVTKTGETVAVRRCHTRHTMVEHGVLDGPMPAHWPPNAIDQIIDEFGAGQVAELTGRSKRMEIVEAPAPGIPTFIYPSRLSCSHRYEERKIPAFKGEAEQFSSDVKRIAVVSAAGSTGLNLHARPGGRQRVHYVLELPWTAEGLVQQCGRSHRANQQTPPMYKFILSDIPSEARLRNALQHRMRTLGALTRGDSQVGWAPQEAEREANGDDGLLPLVSTAAVRGALFEATFRSAVALLQHEGINWSGPLPMLCSDTLVVNSSEMQRLLLPNACPYFMQCDAANSGLRLGALHDPLYRDTLFVEIRLTRAMLTNMSYINVWGGRGGRTRNASPRVCCADLGRAVQAVQGVAHQRARKPATQVSGGNPPSVRG